MKFLTKLLVFVILFACCKSEGNEKLEEEMIKTLRNNDSTLDNTNVKNLFELKSKSEKPETREKGLFYFSKAIKADSVCKKFFKTIEEDCQLQDAFIKFKEQIINSEEIIVREIKTSNESYNLKKEFEKENKDLVKALYQNKAKILRNDIIEIYLKQIGCCILEYDKFQAIASQNSTHFKTNEELEIIAGVGAFEPKAQPTILIDNKVVSVNSDGVAEYRTNVGKKKGKFSKIVSIIFTKPDGQRDSVKIERKYTVD